MPDALAPHLIERFKADSSTIAEIGYESGVCVIQFQNGNLFAYPMTEDEFQAFARAESKGKYFNTAIRGKLAGTKLTGLCSACGAVAVIGEPCDQCGEGVGRAVDRLHKEQK